ncbi:MAG: copper chaperone PCu(A)C [Alphaproteobacteria bacterium]|nr:copper chaperone PCu(A)C [Alphaproteobacteria bacterium]
MKQNKPLALFLACLLWMNVASAESLVSVKDIKIFESSGKTAAAFLTVTNESDKAVKLTKAESGIAEKTELHTMQIDEKGVMRMRQAETLEIAPHGTLTLKPQGDHIMFIGLHEKLALGDMVKLGLTFESEDGVRDAHELTTTVESRAASPEKDATSHGHHH